MKTLIAILLLLGATLAFAKPKPASKTYAASCGQVWPATKAAVENHYDILNVNDAQMSGAFSTGSVWTGVRMLAFSLSGKGEQCTVSVTGHFSGLIHNDKGDFFKRIQRELAKQDKLAAK